MCIRWLEIAALVALGFGWSPQAASSVSYTYTGNSFTAADPPYTTSDKVDGWFSVPLQLAGNLPLTEIGSSLADFSFNDNQQVRTPGNTSVCAFKVATDAAGAIIEWSITLHQSPTPASGNPMQVVDSSGTSGDQGGIATSTGSTCTSVSLTTVASTATPGNWAAGSPLSPSDYHYDGAPYSYADSPYMLGDDVEGTITFSGPLPPYLPSMDLTPFIQGIALDDGVVSWNYQPEIVPITYNYAGNNFSSVDPPYSTSDSLQGWFTLPQPLGVSLVQANVGSALLDFSFSDGQQTRTKANSHVCSFQLSTDAGGNITGWFISFQQSPTPSGGQPQEVMDSGSGFGDQVGIAPSDGTVCATLVPTTVASTATPGIWLTGAVPPNATNSAVCSFAMATNGLGGIADWSFTLRRVPKPATGQPQYTLSSDTTLDQAAIGPAGASACEGFVATAFATTGTGGNWASTAVLPLDPTPYHYTGAPFTAADPPWSVGERVLGSITVDRGLPANTIVANLESALLNFSFNDGVQTRNQDNSEVCQFGVSTDGNGEIVAWTIGLRESPLPAPGQPMQLLDSTTAFDQAGIAAAPLAHCESIVVPTVATSGTSGSWIGNDSSSSGRAVFTVNKVFSDGNPGQVSISLSCNTGLILNQSQTVSQSRNVSFVVTSFADGELNCSVTETDIPGYQSSYNNGSFINDSACVFSGVADGAEHVCTVINTLSPLEVHINKIWVLDSDYIDSFDAGYRLVMYCDGEIVGGIEDTPGSWHLEVYDSDSLGIANNDFQPEVFPNWDGGTACWVTETPWDSSVEVSNGCGSNVNPGLQVEVGGAEPGCTLTNTVFYEGIPVLGPHGLATLVLLLLGVGLIGIRRYG